MGSWALFALVIDCGEHEYTEMEKSVCIWWGEFHYCSCLPVLSGPGLGHT